MFWWKNPLKAKVFEFEFDVTVGKLVEESMLRKKKKC